MSLPKENLNALLKAKMFLYKLLNPKETKKIPKAIRLEARDILKHYPYNHDLTRIYKKEIKKYE